MDLSATPEVFTEQTKKAMMQVSKKRGKNRTDLIIEIATQVGRFIGKQQYEITKLNNLLIMCDTDVVEKLVRERGMLEQEIASDKRLIAKYKKHFQRMEDEINELKKKLGIPSLPWYEQGKDDPVET